MTFFSLSLFFCLSREKLTPGITVLLLLPILSSVLPWFSRPHATVSVADYKFSSQSERNSRKYLPTYHDRCSMVRVTRTTDNINDVGFSRRSSQRSPAGLQERKILSRTVFRRSNGCKGDILYYRFPASFCSRVSCTRNYVKMYSALRLTVRKISLVKRVKGLLEQLLDGRFSPLCLLYVDKKIWDYLWIYTIFILGILWFIN